MSRAMEIVQGDQYALPFHISLGNEEVTPEIAAGIRIQVEDVLQEWPDGGITYDDQRHVWLFPVTEEQTRVWARPTLSGQVGINLGDGDHRYTQTFQINLRKNIIERPWE